MFTFDLYSPQPSRKNCAFDECEDAKPLCKVMDDEKLSVFGVFDGVSSSLPHHNKKHTSSYLGSNETRRIIEEIFNYNDFEQIFSKEEDEIAAIFEERVFKSLLQYSISEGLFNDLPKDLDGPFNLLSTTAAVAFCRKNIDEKGETSVDVICIWAGDSRCYLFDRTGLHQLTKDDQKIYSDAFDSIISQPSPSNLIKISKNRENANTMLFHLNCRKYRFNDRNNPFFILSSTDGCYDHCKSPMHFEKAILDSILESIKPKRSHDIETILKSKINITADDCTLSAGFFSFNANVDEKKLIESVYSQRQKYMENLIGYSEDLQDIISRGDEILKKQSNVESKIKTYLNLFSRYISDPQVRARLEKKYSAIKEQSTDKSLDYLLNNGGIKMSLPEDFSEYSALLSKKDQLSKKLSETKENYDSKFDEYIQNLRKIWYDEYKEEYERVYNNGVVHEKKTDDETSPTDNDSDRNGGVSSQNDGGKAEEPAQKKSNSFHEDSGNNSGGAKQNKGGDTEEEKTPNKSNSSHENSGNNGGGAKQNKGGDTEEEKTPNKSNSSDEDPRSNSDRFAQNNSEKSENGETVSSPHSETWTCHWCGHKISAEHRICPICGRREVYPPPPPPITWNCRECGYNISAKDHPDVCPNCGLIKWSNQNPLKIIWNLFLSGFYKVRHIILKLANLILRTDSKKSNDDKGGF